MAKLKEYLTLFFVKYEVCFYDYKINFNATVVWSQPSTVSVFFSNKKVLVPRTSHVKGLHVQTKFQPVPDNQT